MSSPPLRCHTPFFSSLVASLPAGQIATTGGHLRSHSADPTIVSVDDPSCHVFDRRSRQSPTCQLPSLSLLVSAVSTQLCPVVASCLRHHDLPCIVASFAANVANPIAQWPAPRLPSLAQRPPSPAPPRAASLATPWLAASS